MPDTQAQQIMDALGARLATITVANGYRTNIGASVHEDPMDSVTTSSLPVILYRDVDASTEAELSQHRHTLNVEIGVTLGGTAPLPLVRKVRDDIAKAIGENQSLGGLCISIAPPSFSWEIYQDGDEIVTGVMFKTQISYRTMEWTT